MDTTPLLEIPFLEPADPPSIHGITEAMADRLEEILPHSEVAVNSGGSFATSSASPVDIPGAGFTVAGTGGIMYDLLIFTSISPSGAGDAKVNLVIGGQNFGQVARVAAGGSPGTFRYAMPGSTDGNAVAGGRISGQFSGPSLTIKLQASSTSGSASFVAIIYARIRKGV